MDEKPVEIRDNENQKHILIQVNLKNNNTQVLSNFTAWENIALIFEALGATYQQCIRDGIPERKVKRAITDYLENVLKAYETDRN